MLRCIAVIRYLLARQNKILEREEICSLTNAENWGVEETARCGGATYEEALNPRRGFRYLL